MINYQKYKALLGAVIFNIALATHAQTIMPLTLKTYSGPESSFFVSSTLISGKTEAILIDAQFTRAHAHRVVADILESGKKLTTVYVSAGDPDYYFGLPVIQQAFPEARIVTTAAIYQHIVEHAQKKLDAWSVNLGANGISNVVLPQILKTNELIVDGQKLEINSTPGDDYHSFVWIPSMKTVVGGLDLFGNGLHVWQADAPTSQARSAWRKRLNTIANLNPVALIPAHFVPGKSNGLQSLAYTREYLDAIEAEQAKTSDSVALINAMKIRYPDAQMSLALSIGAKVIKGEMKW